MNDQIEPFEKSPTSLIDALVDLQHAFGLKSLMTPIEIVREATRRASGLAKIKNAEWHPRAPLPDQ